VDPGHEVTEGRIDHAVLLHEAESRERRRRNAHLEMLAVACGIRYLDPSTGQRRFELTPHLFRIHHASLVTRADVMEQEPAIRLMPCRLRGGLGDLPSPGDVDLRTDRRADPPDACRPAAGSAWIAALRPRPR
jgi:hypothetical protein